MSDIDAIARVEQLHAPRGIEATTGDCAVEECDHDEPEDCSTITIQQCGQCAEIAEIANTYYGEDGSATAVTLWPCATIRALRGEDQ